MAQRPSFATPPPSVPDVDVSFPRPHVLLVTLNRPRQLNSIPAELHYALARLYDWYDAEPSLRCAVLTGTGRAFCAGADLKEWNARNASAGTAAPPTPSADPTPVAAVAPSGGENPGDGWRPPAGFGGLSNRDGKKPVIAAVNGLCLGGGMEMAINADLVYASTEARFGLPEVTIGVIAVAGALPRLIKSVGRQRASEMALIGRTDYTPEQLLTWGLVNEVVPPGSLMETAIAAAEAIARNSPDAVIVSREGLKSGWEPVGPVGATAAVEQGIYRRMEAGENMTEGVKSFVEKRKPVYKDSKL
ncbi:enoyl-CoA hydratase/isomerase [Colletotrichum graminicola]|uniref:Enoyl-CoA hydratase/isomerase n=1 Tax=Colletotrichum graminicola (strain M1.001 / M2 / FGSC 10212) TaxID=645133 RepID=E3QV71_COLGM|nr:enoyl-CoA hydratase/isomerase [Colletotrichum graminicola M1.001]EFQ34761.1 enoyl-CoA hydratase/isomerase [Colletotrichum graminicola M1.001]WDK16871.1 enoyl-CoA hydratase/isomerase [Colletotrichum graminicola]